MEKEDLVKLEQMIDAYGLLEVLSGLSYICGEKAEHVAVNWQDTPLGKNWMNLAKAVDACAARVEKLPN